jgi:hypothetical protein
MKQRDMILLAVIAYFVIKAKKEKDAVDKVTDKAKEIWNNTKGGPP